MKLKVQWYHFYIKGVKKMKNKIIGFVTNIYEKIKDIYNLISFENKILIVCIFFLIILLYNAIYFLNRIKYTINDFISADETRIRMFTDNVLNDFEENYVNSINKSDDEPVGEAIEVTKGNANNEEEMDVNPFLDN